jgi:hypothetical protein
VLLFGPFVLYTVMWALLFVGEPRYHHPLLPVFAVLGGIGIAATLGRVLPDRTAPS